MDEQYRQLPLKEHPILRQAGVTPYYRLLVHPTRDDYWEQVAVKRSYDKVLIPALNLGGWFDLFIGGTLENYIRMQSEGGSETARQGQRLLIGPWSHGVFTGLFPDYNYGIYSGQDMIDFTGLQLHFFDHHLKGLDNGLPDEAPVRLFVMGENVWRDEQEWPLARTEYTRWYFHSAGNASTQVGSLSRGHLMNRWTYTCTTHAIPIRTSAA